MSTLKEVKRLHALGFAIHYLHPKSKRPLESGWGSGPRKSLKELLSTNNPEYNIGVRLGTPSKIGEHYLCVIDVDIKSQDKRHLKEALAAVKLLTKGAHCPRVDSGRGNGSRHYYCVVKEPFKTFNPHQSIEIVKVHMPSKKPSKKELEKLTKSEIDKGLRLSHAWEISLYSDGRQTVLPPSTHPDSGRLYIWHAPIESVDDIPLLGFDDIQTNAEVSTITPAHGVEKVKIESLIGFTPIKVDMAIMEISDKTRNAIMHGEGVSDRSAYIKTACEALISAGLTENEILSVLTDKNNFLAHAALERRGNRTKAAEWILNYHLKPMLEKRKPENLFKNFEAPISKGRKLTKDEAAKQLKKVEPHWEQTLDTQGKSGVVKNCMSNLVIILKMGISEKLLIYDEFRLRETYGAKTPWGAKKGSVIDDAEISRIKFWVSKNYGFDPSTNLIHDAISEISHQNSFNPVRDWLDDLEWDQTPRLGSWLLNHFEAEGEPEYLDQVFTKWMVAMIARVYYPGTKFDWMPIFEGDQGYGKSSFGRILSGDKYFLDWLPNLAEKDAAHALQDAWIVEMGELASFRKNEIETIKAFITRTVDKFRPSHGRRLGEYARHCVFFGTTNRKTYLRDDTGNRRFKPVKVGRLDFAQLTEDREQLFAEAKWKFKNEIKNIWELELTGKAKKFEKIIHQEKMVEDESDIMLEQMIIFLQKVADEEVKFNHEKFGLLSLFEGGRPLEKWRPEARNMQFAGKMLRNLGASKSGVKGLNYWKLPEEITILDKPIYLGI